MDMIYTMGPPKPTCLEVFMVNNLVFLGGQNLYFSWFWGLMVYIYNGIYIYCIYTVYIYIFYGYRITSEIYYDMVMLCGQKSYAYSIGA